MGEFAIWNIIEVMSFGDFINLYKFYYSKYPSKDSMSDYLWSARILRNAAAHNNCLLNSLKTPYTRRISLNWEVTKYISQIPGINKDSRTKKMSNPVVYDFVVMLHLFNRVVSSKKAKLYTMNELKELMENRFAKHNEYFSKNEVVTSTFEFMKKIVDFYCGKA
jgi:abortive infection bacteriophage resistance protein